jgi:uncharacterized protein (TIGR03083 family)
MTGEAQDDRTPGPHGKLCAMEPARLLRSCDGDARALLAAAETGWDRPVPHCPGWDVAELARHMGSVLGWMATIVTVGERVNRRKLEPGTDDTGALPTWFLAALSRNVEVLGSADPDSETWTFSSQGDHRVRWWCRRVAVEVAVHRWDAENARLNGGGGLAPGPIDGDVAAVGIEEFVTEFLPGLLGQEAVEGITGTLHLHAVDGPAEWSVGLGAGGSETTLRGTRSDLLLWLMNRGQLANLEVSGNEELLARWAQLEF